MLGVRTIIESKMKRLIIALAATLATIASAHADDIFLDSIFQIKEVSVIEVKDKEIIKPQKLTGAELERHNSHSVAPSATAPAYK